MLDPVLHRQTGGRLGSIEWFRSVWQRGGAATGFSTWTESDGREVDVLVKLPVGPVEHRWTTALGNGAEDHSRPTPRVVAAGLELGGYDLAWLVVERLNGQPLATRLDGESVVDLLKTVVEFQVRAESIAPPVDRPRSPDWANLLERSRSAAKEGGVAEGQRWNEVLKKVQKHLPELAAKWDRRQINAWCHGDVHPGNALRRLNPAGDSRHGCVLVDLALVHAGHWVEDALYLERQYWGHVDMLQGVKPVSTMAKLRRERGLSADDGYADLCTLRRVLMGACAPAMIGREGNPKYLHAALEQVEKCLPQVIH